ncbi:MAG: TonB-dependent receptor [Bacteroidota bacterium]
MKTFLTLIISILSLSVFAHNGTIEGTISDDLTKSELTGVTISLDNGKQYTTTDGLGIFRFLQVVPGRHTITISMVGFTEIVREVTVRDGETSLLKISLVTISNELPSVEIKARNEDAIQHINRLSIQSRPMNSSQDVLRIVPGLFIGQHAGGGKAEQVFLRGFDMDHGTDIRIEADGLPVNMTSHAHGQGYADMHWIIPELISGVDVFKGPFAPQYGNLATGAAVSLKTLDVLPQNFIKLEGGSFNTYRTVAGINLLPKVKRGKSDAYIAGEFVSTDSYFDAPQDFTRINLQAKYKLNINDRNQLLIGASTFASKWNASGQIPDRAVANGSISFYGAINPNEGGKTSRTNVYAKYKQGFRNSDVLEHQLYYSRYEFELFSDFSFFLEDPINGDMIRQYENRNIYGYKNSFNHAFFMGNKKAIFKAGLQFQADDINESELSRVVKRSRNVTDSLAYGNTNEYSAAIWFSQNIEFSNKLSLQAGLRYDQFRFVHLNKLAGSIGELSANKGKASPKLSLFYTPSSKAQLYAHAGYGFHSNDARSILGGDVKKILPTAKGVEIGGIFQPAKTLFVQAAIWRMDFESELVYSGDAAVTEPSNKTLRYGYDLSVRYQFANNLSFENDFTFSHSRDREAAKGENYLALAPRYTSTGGLIYRNKTFDAAIRYRSLGNRPANADYSIVARGYSVTDLNAAYRCNGHLEFTASIANLFNVKWKETQFETESRLQNETQSVSEIHFTPGTRFGFKVGATYRF